MKGFVKICIGLIFLLIVPLTFPEDEAVPVLRIGHVGHDHQIALYVACLETERFRKDYGIYLKEVKEKEVYDLYEGQKKLAQLHLFKVGGGSRMPASMERGEIDIGFGGVASVAFFVDKGNSFKILCPLNTEGDMLVMRKSFPVSNWKEFVEQVKKSEKPVKIGYKAPVAVAKLIFVRALEEENLSYLESSEERGKSAKIELVNLQGGKNMVPCLASGAVDGFVMNQPEVSRAVVRGLGKVVCELAELPPEGKWNDHPCCCIVARGEIVEKHCDEVKCLLKVILMATQLINEDKELAIKDASKWTKISEEIERDSVPSIVYLAIPTKRWKAGMVTWIEMMNEIGKFKGDLANLKAEDVEAKLYDFSLVDEAEKELKRSWFLN